MIGISWGGFNGLQIAARRPEALKAVITICSTGLKWMSSKMMAGIFWMRSRVTNVFFPKTGARRFRAISSDPQLDGPAI